MTADDTNAYAGALLDIRRRALGLSIDETASVCDVQGRTVQRWLYEGWRIRPDAWDALGALEDAMHAAVDRALTATLDAGVDQVTLWHYRSAEGREASPHASQLPGGAHAVMVGWLADALEDAGVKVAIEWAD